MICTKRFLLLPFFAWLCIAQLSAQNEAASSPYILYWGGLEARFTYVQQRDAYTAEWKLTTEAILEAIKREPRLWDGATLRDTLNFELNGLAVNSDYNHPEVYQSGLPKLQEAVSALKEGERVAIEKIILPDGKKGSIAISIDRPKQQASAETAIRASNNIASIQWGKQAFLFQETRFMTTAEFWDMLLSEPQVQYKNQQSQRPEQWMLAIANGENYILRARANVNEAMDLNQIRERIDREHESIRAGATLQFSVWDAWGEDSENNLDTIATFDPLTKEERIIVLRRDGSRASLNLPAEHLLSCTIVDDRDPRRFLKHQDRYRFYFKWGAFSNIINWNSLYAQSYVSSDTFSQIYADNRFTTWNGKLSKKEVLYMLRQQPKLYRDSVLLNDLTFTISYKGYSQNIDSKAVPADWIKKLERELQAGETLTISAMQARINPTRYIVSLSKEAQEKLEAKLARKIEAPEVLINGDQQLTRMALPLKEFKTLQQALKGAPGFWFQSGDLDFSQITFELEIRDEDPKPALPAAKSKSNN